MKCNGIYINKYDEFNVPQTLKEHAQFVNEAYFGKTVNLVKLEKCIGELRAEYTLKKNYTATPEMKRIEQCIKDQFGFEYVNLNIIPQNIPNAFTYTLGIRFDIIKEDKLRKMVIANQKDGYRFKEGNGFVLIVAIYGGVLANKNFTDAEIVAILLHEIGHNFADVISKDIRLANYQFYQNWFEIVLLRALFNLGFTLPEDIAFTITNNNDYQEKEKQKEKPVGAVKSFFQYISGRLSDLEFNTKVFKSRIINGIIGSIYGQNALDSRANSTVGSKRILTTPGRQNEVIADKFAAIYGYGSEQVTALSKMTLDTYPAEDILAKLPFGNMLLKYDAELGKDYHKYDVHPNIVQRANTMIQSLEFELKKKDLDPEMRKIIQKQIKEMQDCKAAFMKIEKDDNARAQVEKAYAAVVDKKMPDATTAKLEDEINKQIDELCNKKY